MKDVWSDGYFCLLDIVQNHLRKTLNEGSSESIKPVDVTVGGCLISNKRGVAGSCGSYSSSFIRKLHAGIQWKHQFIVAPAVSKCLSFPTFTLAFGIIWVFCFIIFFIIVIVAMLESYDTDKSHCYSIGTFIMPG